MNILQYLNAHFMPIEVPTQEHPNRLIYQRTANPSLQLPLPLEYEHPFVRVYKEMALSIEYAATPTIDFAVIANYSTLEEKTTFEEKWRELFNSFGPRIPVAGDSPPSTSQVLASCVDVYGHFKWIQRNNTVTSFITLKQPIDDPNKKTNRSGVHYTHLGMAERHAWTRRDTLRGLVKTVDQPPPVVIHTLPAVVVPVHQFTRWIVVLYAPAPGVLASKVDDETIEDYFHSYASRGERDVFYFVLIL